MTLESLQRGQEIAREVSSIKKEKDKIKKSLTYASHDADVAIRIPLNGSTEVISMSNQSFQNGMKFLLMEKDNQIKKLEQEFKNL